MPVPTRRPDGRWGCPSHVAEWRWVWSLMTQRMTRGMTRDSLLLVLRPEVIWPVRMSVLVRPAIHRRHFGKVPVRRWRRRQPFERRGPPGIGLSHRAPDETVHEVVEEHELERDHREERVRRDLAEMVEP